MILATRRELHLNSEGDKWEITEDEEKRLFIRYTPNPAGGGRQRILTMEEFLSPEHCGPQQDAIQKLIDSGELSILPGKRKPHLA
jgi:hypothetical protein